MTPALVLAAALADFSTMVQGGGICIDKVAHKALVDVNEAGTEAAAVTDVVMVDSAPRRSS